MGKRGAASLPALRAIKGTNRPHRKEPKTPELKLSLCPKPPAYLDAYAVEEWERVAPGLWQAGLLYQEDSFAFGNYCASFSIYRSCCEAFNRMREADTMTNGVLIQGLHGPVKNPLLREMQSTARECLLFAAQFGLTPTTRARLTLEAEAPAPAQNNNRKYFS